MKPRMAPLLSKKFLMESNLELLSKMKCFIKVLFIFTVLRLKLILFWYILIFYFCYINLYL
ncbi:hypothetical protein EXM98_17580 [Clostridium botulinum]|nr:hypothetical protein RSJ13_16090 [Clostridium botulinum]AUN19015.1 hypothetical protein B2M06_15930 [Clostridium botulinum]MBN3354200.1 hypothetical protein [Clostridium botulinum]MBN3408271.1 hypothetical protein [Clostridium botulinum]MBY6798008.1 hypothetical protein [Clostridium botulinum]